MQLNRVIVSGDADGLFDVSWQRSSEFLELTKVIVGCNILVLANDKIAACSRMGFQKMSTCRAITKNPTVKKYWGSNCMRLHKPALQPDSELVKSKKERLP